MAADTTQFSQTERFIFTVLRSLTGRATATSRRVSAIFLTWSMVTWVFGSYAAQLGHAWEESVPTVRYNLYELPTAKRAMQQLSSTVSFFWENRSLREGLQDLCRTHDLSLWLDRRVNPNQLISFKVNARSNDQSLEAALDKIATLVQADSVLIENVIYFGPKDQTRYIQCAAVKLHDSISRQAGQDLTHMRGLQWEELSTPSDILARIADAWKVQIEGALPHDLLHAGQLAGQSTLATQLTIVCGGFGVEAEAVQSGQFKLRELEQQDRWQTIYSKSSLNASAMERSQLNQLVETYPRSIFREQAEQCEVLATTDFHLALLKPTARVKRRTDLTRERWSFEVQNKPAGIVIQYFADSIGLDVQWDEKCSTSDREQIISFRVDNVDIDDLLRQFAQASRLTVHREEFSVRISP